MDAATANTLNDLKSFLRRVGLSDESGQLERAFFGSDAILYCNSNLVVRAAPDRGFGWFADLAVNPPGEEGWYDAAILRDLLLGSGPDVLSFSDQVALIKELWPQIVQSFDKKHLNSTVERLRVLRRERVKRRFGTQIT